MNIGDPPPGLSSTTRYRATAREYISDEFWQRVRYLRSIMLRGTRALYYRAHNMRYTHTPPRTSRAPRFRDGKTPVVCYLLRSQRDWKLRTPAEVTRSRHPLLPPRLGVVIPFLSLTEARPTWCLSTPPWLNTALHPFQIAISWTGSVPTVDRFPTGTNVPLAPTALVIIR